MKSNSKNFPILRHRREKTVDRNFYPSEVCYLAFSSLLVKFRPDRFWFLITRDLVTTGIIWVVTGSNIVDEATTSSPITPTQQMKNFGSTENSEKCNKFSSNRLSPEHNDCKSRDPESDPHITTGAKDEIYSSQCRACVQPGDLNVGTDSEMGKWQRNMTIIKALPDDSECTHTVKNIVNNVTVGITCYRDGYDRCNVKLCSI